MSDLKRLVDLHSRLTVVSSKPIAPGKTHRFTALDHAMGLHSLHIIFYYRANPFNDGPLDMGLGDLRVSLSEVLSLYPPVTGRLIRGEDGYWEVKCNDAGVRTLRASVGTTVDEWLRSAGESDERYLTVWEDMPDSPNIWSPFRLQINEFEGGGLAIGLSCTHMHADPTTATLLVKSWTDVHRGDPIAHPPIFNQPATVDRPSQNTTETSTKYYSAKSKSESTPHSPTKMATATFKFSHAMISQCLAQVHDKCLDATPFDLLTALFWTRIARLKAPKQNNTHSLSICIDFRKLMKKPIPYGYFGNFVHFSSLSLDAKELEDGRLGHVAGTVHRHVAGLDEEDYLSFIDWLESNKGERGQYEPPLRIYGPDLTCINMEHMIDQWGPKESSYQPLMYSAVFKNDERPVHVSYHVGNIEGEGLMLVMPSLEEGLGRTVTVTLPEEQITKLCVDQEILNLEPIKCAL